MEGGLSFELSGLHLPAPATTPRSAINISQAVISHAFFRIDVTGVKLFETQSAFFWGVLDT